MRKGWVYERITAGLIFATRYAATGCSVIPDDPALLARLRTLAQETVSRRRAW